VALEGLGDLGDLEGLHVKLLESRDSLVALEGLVDLGDLEDRGDQEGLHVVKQLERRESLVALEGPEDQVGRVDQADRVIMVV
jgi:hypothetical protein